MIPYPNGEKSRPNPLVERKEEKPRFSFTKGVLPGLFNGAEAGREVVFLVEGETDTMRLWQELRGAQSEAGVVGLSGVNTWTKQKAEGFESAKTVYVILDNDDYMVAPQVDAAWREIKVDLGQKAKRLRLPEGVKDVCEFFDLYDLETLRLTAAKSWVSKSRYSPLDLRTPPPPPNWLVDGLLSMGDITLIPGPSGVGKSWLTLGLCVAVADRRSEFLGLGVNHNGRVLYVDEENPEDVVRIRLKQLGLSDDGISNIRYLWNEGIRLDRDPQRFIDEAVEFEPTVVVLDSFTRLHTQDENNAGAVAALFNDAIKPLARLTGASVLLIHHDNKSGAPRGSVDIMASVDAAIQARSAGEANPGCFHLRQIKSRRRLHGSEIDVSIRDDDEHDLVHLVANEPLNPPF